MIWRIYSVFIALSVSFLLFGLSIGFAQDSKKNDSAIQREVELQEKLIQNPLGIALYEPNYILPFYRTVSPDYAVYENNTPNSQKLDRMETKYQFSFQVPLWYNIFDLPYTLSMAYTQLSYWQSYANSPYFRETNYQPEIFVSWHFLENYLGSFGFVHASNGRGGDFERSWNRAYIDLKYSGEHWLVGVKPWMLICKTHSSDANNRDIADYLGYGEFLFAYQWPSSVQASLVVRNVEHAQRTTFITGLSLPLNSRIRGYVQVFSGYGQSLIEYNHRTNSLGVGISFNDWMV
jgi:phospholipase A1/A2